MYDVLPDIPRIYTALAEFLASLIYILLYQKHGRNLKFYTHVLAMGGIQVLLQFIAGLLPLQYWLLAMIGNLCWMYCTIYYSTPVNRRFAVYLSLKAFVLAEFTASIVWQIYTFFFYGKVDMHHSVLGFFVIGAYIIIVLVVYILEKKQSVKEVIMDLELKEIFVTGSITSIVFLMSNIGFLLTTTGYDFGNQIAIYTMRTVVNFNGLCIIFLLQVQKYDRYLKDEIDKINNVFGSRQYQKYMVYKESAEVTQQKLHDLKHQVYIIKHEENRALRDSQIDSVIEEISNMSGNIDTGNLVLDTILTNKNTFCIEQKITFSCIADGKLLNFMEIADICSIFGNALDNAIEYVTKEKRLEKRLINLRVIEKQQFVIIKVDNYCETKPEFYGGLPVTTKQDKNNHGYGLKSIRYTAEKYNGTMTVSFEENWFTIKILLPKRT